MNGWLPTSFYREEYRTRGGGRWTKNVVILSAAPLCRALWFIQIRILYWIIIIKILMIKVGLWFIYAMQWILIPSIDRPQCLSGTHGHHTTRPRQRFTVPVPSRSFTSKVHSCRCWSLVWHERAYVEGRFLPEREREWGGIKPRWRILIWYRVVTTVSN